MSTDMDFYKCEKETCHAVFCVECGEEANSCPKCQSQNLEKIGTGTLNDLTALR